MCPNYIYPTGEAVGSGTLVVTALPAAGSSYEGVVAVLLGGAGVSDKLYVCLKSDAGVFSWVQLAEGGA
jgi:hypothetical protein